MGYYIVQAGSSLKKMSTAGVLTDLTLPTGVTIDSSKRMRAVVVGNITIIVNSASDNITVDRNDNVRLLCPKPPASKPVLTTAASGSLNGTFTTKETYLIKDDFGNLLAESDFGPVSDASATLASQYLVSTATISPQPGVSARREYRTTTGPGTTYFPWIDVEGNTVQSVQSDMSDAALSLIAAPTDLGTPPKFTLITIWKNRVWGCGPDAPDTLYQSGNGKPYAFPSSRTIPVPPVNADTVGISGFLARKDDLLVGKRNSLHKIIGTSESNFTRQVVTEKVGIWAPDSCQVISDVGYFLGNPFGIYEYGTAGLKNITLDKVQDWFAKDTYFNRAEFENAIGFYHPVLHAYVVLLAAAGGTDLNRWILYDITAQTWWGPHKTGAFTPTGAANLRDGNDIAIMGLLASDGKIYKETTTKTDGSNTAIDFDCITNWLSGGTPAIHKTFLDPEVVTKVQSGGTLTVTPTVGKTNASAQSSMSHDMTLGNERLPRIGEGELLRLQLREATAAQDVVVYGLEIPFFENGRRS